MNMNGLESLLMGFVSGLAEMLPISADAHRLIVRTIFGIPSEDALFRLFCHIGSLLMLLWLFQPDLRHLRRTSRIMKTPPRRRRQQLDLASSFTLRLLRLAAGILVAVRLLLWKLNDIENRPGLMALMLIVNGVVLLVPSLIRSGNMDSRNMPKITGAFMGLGAGLGGVPGLSHMGLVTSFAVGSGVERHYAMRFAFLLLIPGLMVESLFDLSALILGGVPTVTGRGMAFALLGAVVCAFSTYLGTRLMRRIADSRGLDGFAYYCWGAALLCYLLFLIV